MDPEKVANLLLIPQYFDLEIYTSGRQEKVTATTLSIYLLIIPVTLSYQELQVKRGNRDNLGIISHISSLKHIL